MLKFDWDSGKYHSYTSENFVSAGWQIPFTWSRWCGQTTACTTACSLAPLQAALSLPRFDLNSSRTRFDILSAAADSHAAPKAAHIPTATVVFDTFASGTSTNKTRRREINNNKGFQRTCVTRFAWQVELDLWFAGWVLPFIDGICLFTRHMWPFEF